MEVYFKLIDKAYLPDFIKLALTKGKNDDLKVIINFNIKFELIGLMANIRIGNGWLDYINNAFLDFIHQNMVNGAVEVIMFHKKRMISS